MRLLTERAAFLVGFVDLPYVAECDGAEWEYFQIAHLNDDGVNWAVATGQEPDIWPEDEPV